jgi:hypothetical protein
MLIAAYYDDNAEQNGQWHRAMVLGIESPTLLNLRYVDFGTSVKFVELSNCRWLHERFGRLPAQAIPARLTGLRPIRVNEWSETAVAVFNDLQRCNQFTVVKARLMGFFVCRLLPHRVYRDRVRGLSLCLYLNKDEDCLNDLYLKRKLAKADSRDVTPAGVMRWHDSVYCGRSDSGEKKEPESKEPTDQHAEERRGAAARLDEAAEGGNEAEGRDPDAVPPAGKQEQDDEEEGGDSSDDEEEKVGKAAEKVRKWLGLE